MTRLLTWLGIYKPVIEENYKPIIKIAKSIYPVDRPSEQEWIIEYRVSLLHGKQAVHF